MTTRDVRAEVLTAFGSILEDEGIPRSKVEAVVKRLEQACTGRGVKLTRPAVSEDPAADWHPSDEPAAADPSAWVEQTRKNLRAALGRETADAGPELPVLPPLPSDHSDKGH